MRFRLRNPDLGSVVAALAILAIATPTAAHAGRVPPALSITGPSTINFGACTAYTVSASKRSHKTITVSLTNTGSGHFFSDSACTLEIQDLALQGTRAPSAIFYFRDKNVETTTISATDLSGRYQTATLSVTILPPVVSTLGLGGIASGFPDPDGKCALFNGMLDCTENQAPLLPSPITSVAGAYLSFCAVAAGNVYCWIDGTSTAIQVSGLPSGSVTQVAGPTASNGGLYCAIANGDVYCWQYGLLLPPPVASATGVGSASQVVTYRNDGFCVVQNGHPVCSGIAPLMPLTLTQGTTGIALVQRDGGPLNLCGLKADGTVACADDPTTPDIAAGAALISGAHLVAAISNVSAYGVCAAVGSNVECWGSSFGAVPVTIPGISGNITELKGHSQFCGIANQRLYCWFAPGPNVSDTAMLTYF